MGGSQCIGDRGTGGCRLFGMGCVCGGGGGGGISNLRIGRMGSIPVVV